MAKAKKSAAAPAKKAAGKQAKKVETPAGQPLIDTGAAADAAARQLLGKAKLGEPEAPAEEAGKESAAFKQLKQNAKGPAPSNIAKSLGHTFAPKNTLPGRSGQTFHSQTQGFASRVNVPRRTGG